MNSLYFLAFLTIALFLASCDTKEDNKKITISDHNFSIPSQFVTSSARDGINFSIPLNHIEHSTKERAHIFGFMKKFDRPSMFEMWMNSHANKLVLSGKRFGFDTYKVSYSKNTIWLVNYQEKRLYICRMNPQKTALSICDTHVQLLETIWLKYSIPYAQLKDWKAIDRKVVALFLSFREPDKTMR